MTERISYFQTLRRRLEAFAYRQSHPLKRRTLTQEGYISSLEPLLGHGHICSEDGRELFFRAENVLNADFDDLLVGAVVRFSEAYADEGELAVAIQVIAPPKGL